VSRVFRPQMRQKPALNYQCREFSYGSPLPHYRRERARVRAPLSLTASSLSRRTHEPCSRGGKRVAEQGTLSRVQCGRGDKPLCVLHCSWVAGEASRRASRRATHRGAADGLTVRGPASLGTRAVIAAYDKRWPSSTAKRYCRNRSARRASRLRLSPPVSSTRCRARWTATSSQGRSGSGGSGLGLRVAIGSRVSAVC
jgi:hypothetical protein